MPQQQQGDCKTEACKIQTCLRLKNYDANNCKDQIDALKRCCERIDGAPVHCAFVGSQRVRT